MIPRASDIDVLCFSCRGPLFDWSAGLLVCMQPILEAHELRVDREAVAAAFVRAETAVFADAQTCVALSWSQAMGRVYSGVAADLGLPVVEADVERLRRSAATWPVQLDAREVLARLAGQLKFAVASNLPEDQLLDMLPALQVDFELVVCADFVGHYKPAAAVFERIVEQFPGPRARILCVSTSMLYDLEPAAKLGLSTAQLLRTGPGQRADDSPAHLAFADFYALEDWLRGHEKAPGKRSAGG